ncbi:MAG: hypothetical protein ACTFAK_10655 [Candidatus Electronema sp. VV]
MDFSFGGISFEMNTFFCDFGKKIIPPQLIMFFEIDSAEDKRKNDKRGRVRIFLSKKQFSPQPECQIFFSDTKIKFYKTKNEKYQIIHFANNEKDILWHVTSNHDFSHAEYSFSIEAKNLFQLIFSRFVLQHTFINHHGLIIHAAGGSIKGKGMVFPAVSGTGKSTLSHLLLPYPENQLFSEERIIMRRMDDNWRLWGTPWHGTGVIARNESAPLNALVFLNQAPETKISKLPPSVALRRLLETVSIPWYSQEWTDKGLTVCESLLRTIPAYELAFRPDQTAVQAVAELAASLD